MWVNVVWACDLIACGVGGACVLWAFGRAAGELCRRPASVRRDPGHYGTRAS